MEFHFWPALLGVLLLACAAVMYWAASWRDATRRRGSTRRSIPSNLTIELAPVLPVVVITPDNGQRPPWEVVPGWIGEKAFDTTGAVQPEPMPALLAKRSLLALPMCPATLTTETIPPDRK